MSIKNTALRAALRKVGKKRTPDYREKLSRMTPGPEQEAEATHAAHEPAARIRRLKGESKTDSLAFQSVVVAAIKVLSRQLQSEYAVVSAAISLSQQQKSREMVHTVERTIDALTELLSPQGHRMLGMNAHPADNEDADGSWTRSLERAHHVCSESAQWMRSVVSGQPEEGPACRLAGIITELLQQHDSAFIHAAEELNF